MKKFKIILIVIALLVIYVIYSNNTINKNTGLINSKFKKLKDSPNGVSSQSNIEEKYVDPIKYSGDLDLVKEYIKNNIQKIGNVKLIKEKNNYLHFVFTTEVFHFKDDFELIIDEKEKLINIKSQSRVGYSDLGVNRERYKKFKKLLSKF